MKDFLYLMNPTRWAILGTVILAPLARRIAHVLGQQVLEEGAV